MSDPIYLLYSVAFVGSICGAFLFGWLVAMILVANLRRQEIIDEAERGDE